MRWTDVVADSSHFIMRLRALIIILLATTASHAAAAQAPGRNPPPQVPRVIRDFCPGEGCEYGDWIACAPLTVHSAEDASSPVAFTLATGTRFRAVTGNLHVVRAGLVVFLDTVRVSDDELLGNDTLVFTPADSLYPLFYGAEGSGNWYLHGRDGGGPWFFPDARNDWARMPGVVLVRSPQVTWWVRVRNAAGREAWLDATNASIAGTAPHYEDSPPRCPERG